MTNSNRTVLVAEHRDEPWRLVRVRAWDRVRAHLDSLALDAQLAAGEPTATDRLRAVRAAMLVAPAKRQQLASGWHGVLLSGPTTPAARRAVVEVRPAEVARARDEIEALIAVLRTERPVDPRGVALANLLLTDGTGPLYNDADPRNVRDELRTALDLLLASA